MLRGCCVLTSLPMLHPFKAVSGALFVASVLFACDEEAADPADENLEAWRRAQELTRVPIAGSTTMTRPTRKSPWIRRVERGVPQTPTMYRWISPAKTQATLPTPHVTGMRRAKRASRMPRPVDRLRQFCPVASTTSPCLARPRIRRAARQAPSRTWSLSRRSIRPACPVSGRGGVRHPFQRRFGLSRYVGFLGAQCRSTGVQHGHSTPRVRG